MKLSYNLALLALSSSMITVCCSELTEFRVLDNNGLHAVKSYDVESKLSHKSIDELYAFLNAGCKIKAIKLDNGDYVLREHVPGLGGGPVTGASVYFSGLVATFCATATALATGNDPKHVFVVGIGLTNAASLAATALPTP